MAKELSKTEDAIVGICLDESLSMNSCRLPTIEGFNDCLKKIRKQKGKNFVTLTQFSAYPGEPNFRIVYENTSAKDVKKLDTNSYCPRGNTPLFDAIGHTISKMQKELDRYKKSEQPAAVCIIQSDGEENVSVDYTQAEILKLIEKKEKAGWTFQFLGANMDGAKARDIARSVGVPAAAAMAYDGATSSQAFLATSDMLASVKARRLTGVATASAAAGAMTYASYETRTSDTTSDGKVDPKTPTGFGAMDKKVPRRRSGTTK